jgi:hypothetical protein
MCESLKRPGRYYLLKWPSDRAMASIKAKVREMTQRRFVGWSLEAVVVVAITDFSPDSITEIPHP